jgi:UrcA family protein
MPDLASNASMEEGPLLAPQKTDGSPRRSAMTRPHRKPVFIAAVLVLLGGAGLQSVASAQSDSLSEVVVESGPVTRSVVGRGLATGIPIERADIDYQVSYSDLDLAKHADVLKLQGRIESAARSACVQLDEHFVFHVSYQQTRDCIDSAIQGASKPMQQAIADGPEEVIQE